MKTLTGIFTLAAIAFAQSGGTFNGPIAGYVLDGGSHALRPVLGIPGSAALGAPIDAGYSWRAAYVAPRQDSFFGIAADGSTHWFTIATGIFHQGSMTGLLASPDRIAFSPAGTSAALIARGQIQFITGLPATPAVGATLNVTGSNPKQGRRPGAALAISDDGAAALIALDGSIQLATPNGVVRPVVQSGADAVMAFAPGTHDAVIAARGTGAIRIQDVTGSALQHPLAADGPEFNAISGIANAADGRTFVASGSKQSVIVFDAAGKRTDVPSSIAPVELTAMGTAYRLNGLSSDPLWMFDAGATGPRIVFVPALRAAQ
jgi:hypothetical protein